MNELFIYKLLQSKNCPNIIFYGAENTGKRRKIYNILSSIYTLTKEEILSCKTIIYTKNNIYYKFNMKYMTNKNLDDFINILDEIINTKNYYSNLMNKMIIMENFSEIKYTLQNILRVKIEKYRITTVFILITNNLTSIIDPLKSRCLCIRNSLKKEKELNEKLEGIYDSKIIEVFDSQMKDLQAFLFPHDILINQIIKIYEQNYNKNSIQKLKEICYSILKYNLPINKFYSIFLIRLLKNPRITDKKKSKLIYLFANSQYNFIKSYRSLIILESLLINIYSILNDSILNCAILTA